MKKELSEFKLVCENSMQSYSAAYDLFELLKGEMDHSAFQKLYIKYASDIASIFDYFDNELNNPEYNNHLSILELQAIMLRLSRHHIKRAKTIENIAQFFKESLSCLAECSEEQLLRLKIKNAEYIDRPSLMILNRLLKLTSDQKLQISINFDFNKDVLKSSESNRLVNSRIQVFNKMDRLTNLSQFSTFQRDLLSNEDFFLNERLYNDIILDASIIEQNFELAFLILNKSLKSPLEKKVISDQMAFRNLGVIEANLGNFKNALSLFDEAISNSESLIERSRNSYIKGLCLIKRMKRVEEGVEVMDNALKELDENFVEGSVKYMHEKAWLINGLCLGKTILASKKKNEAKNKDFVHIIQREMEAYKLISNQTSFRLIYLKFNLLANIAFLLEIQGRYDQAINFWEKSFAPILANDGDYQEGEKSLTYRLGVLKIHLNKYEESRKHLNRSLQLAEVENNQFHINVILYALGYLEISIGNHKESIRYLNEGYKISLHLGDRTTEQLFLSALDYCKGRTENKEIEQPKAKLTSYIPYLDLSFVPEIDLNKALTS